MHTWDCTYTHTSVQLVDHIFQSNWLNMYGHILQFVQSTVLCSYEEENISSFSWQDPQMTEVVQEWWDVLNLKPITPVMCFYFLNLSNSLLNKIKNIIFHVISFARLRTNNLFSPLNLIFGFPELSMQYTIVNINFIEKEAKKKKK